MGAAPKRTHSCKHAPLLQAPALLGYRTLPIASICNSAAVEIELDRQTADHMLAWAPIYGFLVNNVIQLKSEVRGTWSAASGVRQSPLHTRKQHTRGVALLLPPRRRACLGQRWRSASAGWTT